MVDVPGLAPDMANMTQLAGPASPDPPAFQSSPFSGTRDPATGTARAEASSVSTQARPKRIEDPMI